MDILDLKTKLKNHKIAFLARYVQILKLHNKEDLTDEEKKELDILRNKGKLLVDELNKVKESHKLLLNNLANSRFIQDKDSSIELKNKPDTVSTTKTCNLCHENVDHDIIDCPMNCCKTLDGTCLR